MIRVRATGAARRVVTAAIRCYQLLLSPLFPSSCRFHPTCSHFMAEAVAIHGVVRGTGLGVRRILRCHPFNPGGYDPVPPARLARPAPPAPRS